MLFILVYLTCLFIAPQLWVEPFVGMRVDFFIYPAWLAYCLFTGRLPRLFRLDAQDAFFLAMILWMLLSALLKGMNEDSSKIIQDYAKWFLLYRLVVVTVGDVERLRKMALMLLFFAAILAVEGIQHMYSVDGLGWAGQSFGWVDGSATEIGLDRRTRWINIFDGPGVFCVAYTLGLPFALQYVAAPYGKLTRIAGAGLAALLLTGIYYTGARGGYLTAIAIVALFVALKSGISLPRLLVGGVLGLLVLLAAPSYVTSTRDSHGSAQHRVDMWAKGLEMVRYNPVLGIGKGNFKYYTGRLIAHNSAIEIMGETGLVGLFLWLGMIYMALKKLVLYQQLEGGSAALRACAVAVGLSIAGYLVSAMFVTLEYETFYVLLAMSAVVGTALPKPARFRLSEALLLAGAIAAFFSMVKVFVMMYY